MLAGLSGAAREEFIDALIPLQEACIIAHVEATGFRSWGTDETRDVMAARLCGLLDLYAVSDDRLEIRKISSTEWRAGAFVGGGRELVFSDGRPPVRGLTVTRKGLDQAIEQIVAALPGSGGG